MFPPVDDGTDTVVFRLVTSAYELNRSGACHGSLGRSNRVTFYPKKESLSKNSFSLLRGIHLLHNYIPSKSKKPHRDENLLL